MAIISVESLITNSRRVDLIVIVGQLGILRDIQGKCTNDPRLVFLEGKISDTSSGVILQRIFQEYTECDLIRVTPGIIVPLHWDSLLQQAAYQEPAVGSVSPLCNGSALFSLFQTTESEMLASKNLDLVGAILKRLQQEKIFQVPVFSPNIVFIKNQVLEKILPSISSCSEVSSDFNLAAMIYQNGFLNIIAGNIYAHNRNKYLEEVNKKIDEKAEVQLVNAAHPASVLRHLSADALIKGNSLIGDCQPVQLHVMHSWGGGLHKWVSDYCNEDKTRRNLVLKSIGDWDAFGKRLALFEHPDALEPIAYWDLGTPVQSVDLNNIEYRNILNSIIDQYGVDIIWVSSLIGHSFDVLNTDVKTGFICHDYFPVCPAINIYYDGVCSTCDASKMRSCFDKNEHNRFFKSHSTNEWFAVRELFTASVLFNNIDLVIPTPSIKDYLVALHPALGSAKFTVIPHGKENNLPVNAGAVSSGDDEELRVVVLGELAPHKGQDLLASVINDLPNNVHIHLLGCGQGCGLFKRYKNITIVEKYLHNELPSIIEAINPDIGLLLSVWPETFSYTLSELLELGIPPAATKLGAFKDRVIDGENGFLFEPKPDALLELINKLRTDKWLITKVKGNLENIHNRKPYEMVANYHQLTAEFNHNSLAVLCVGDNDQSQEKKSGLLLSYDLDTAIREFSNFFKTKVSQTKSLKSFSKRVAMLVVEVWLILPRFALRMRGILRK